MIIHGPGTGLGYPLFQCVSLLFALMPCESEAARASPDPSES